MDSDDCGNTPHAMTITLSTLFLCLCLFLSKKPSSKLGHIRSHARVIMRAEPLVPLFV